MHCNNYQLLTFILKMPGPPCSHYLILIFNIADTDTDQLTSPHIDISGKGHCPGNLHHRFPHLNAHFAPEGTSSKGCDATFHIWKTGFAVSESGRCQVPSSLQLSTFGCVAKWTHKQSVERLQAPVYTNTNTDTLNTHSSTGTTQSP